jgi:hypothetical protein
VVGADFAWATYLVFQQLVPPPAFPWLPPRSGRARLGRALGYGLLAPAIVTAFVADNVLAGVARAVDRGNAYRIVARKGAGPADKAGTS